MSAPAPAPAPAPARTWSAGERAVPALLAALGVVAALLAVVEGTAGPLSGPATTVRAAATVAFLLVGPGWAVAGFLRGTRLAARAVLAVATGLAVSILAGQAMVVSGAWHPVGLMLALTAATVPLLVRHAVTTR